jgi:tape measure domain-containing protein
MATEPLDIRIRIDGTRVVTSGLREVGNEGERASKRVIKGFSLVSEEANSVSRSIFLVRRALTTIFVASGARAFTRMINDFTEMSNQLKTVARNETELVAIRERLFRISQDTLAPFDALSTLYARTKRAAKDLGFAENELLQFTELLAKEVTLGGATAAEANNAIRQLTQGMGAAGLKGEELTSVLEQLPTVADRIAEGMGVSTNSLRKLGAQGLVTGKDVIKGLLAARETIDARFKSITVSPGKAFGKLGEAIAFQIGKFGESSGITQELSSGILEVTANLESLAKDGFLVAGTASTVYLGKLLLIGPIIKSIQLASAARTAAEVATSTARTAGLASENAALLKVQQTYAANAVQARARTAAAVAESRATAAAAANAAKASQSATAAAAGFSGSLTSLVARAGRLSVLGLALYGINNEINRIAGTRGVGTTLNLLAAGIRKIVDALADSVQYIREAVQEYLKLPKVSSTVNDIITAATRTPQDIEGARRQAANNFLQGRFKLIQLQRKELLRALDASLEEGDRLFANTFITRNKGLGLQAVRTLQDVRELKDAIQELGNDPSIDKVLELYGQGRQPFKPADSFSPTLIGEEFNAEVARANRARDTQRQLDNQKETGQDTFVGSALQATIQENEALARKKQLQDEILLTLQQIQGIADSAGPKVSEQANQISEVNQSIKASLDTLADGDSLEQSTEAIARYKEVLESVKPSLDELQKALALGTQNEALRADLTRKIQEAEEVLREETSKVTEKQNQAVIRESQAAIEAANAILSSGAAAIANNISQAFTNVVAQIQAAGAAAQAAASGGGAGSGTAAPDRAATGISGQGSASSAISQQNSQLQTMIDRLGQARNATDNVSGGLQNMGQQGQKALKDVGDAGQQQGNLLQDIFGSVFRTLEEGLVQYVTTGKVDFKGLINSMLSDIARLVIRMLIIKPLLGLFGGGGGGGGGGGLGGLGGALGFSQGGEVPGFASGGSVRGPGTGVSDSILARLSAGEFVVNAQVARQHTPSLNHLNQTGRLPSGGGAVVNFAPSTVINVSGQGEGSDPEVGRRISKQFNAALEVKFNEMVARERRPGGAFSETQRNFN